VLFVKPEGKVPHNRGKIKPAFAASKTPGRPQIKLALAAGVPQPKSVAARRESALI